MMLEEAVTCIKSLSILQIIQQPVCYLLSTEVCLIYFLNMQLVPEKVFTRLYSFLREYV